jgi:hypothetical protein
MRYLLLVLAICVCAFAVDNVSVPFRFIGGTPALASQANANYDSIVAKTNRAIDTLNRGVVHFNQGTLTHDSVVHYVRVDTIRSRPDIDSICGLIKIDSYNGKSILDTLLVDSIKSAAGIAAPKFTGDLTGTSDSSKGCNHLKGGAVDATTGKFDSLQIAVGSWFKNYKEATAPCSLYDSSKFVSASTIKYVICGKMVTAWFNDLYSTVDSATHFQSIPIEIRPTGTLNLTIIGYKGLQSQMCKLRINANSNRWDLQEADGSPIKGGFCGLQYTCITYYLQ